MGPKLEAVAGPLEGDTFPLGDGQEISIGREPGNTIAVLDSSVSRRHCVLVQRAGGWVVCDLGSRNGTRLNGLPVSEQALREGDEIRVGASTFRYSERDREPANISEVVIREEAELHPAPANATVVLRREDLAYLAEGRDHLPSARITRDLAALVSFSRQVNSIRSVEALQRAILDFVFEVAPAERAAVLLVDEAARDFSRVLGRDRKTAQPRPIEVSRTILKQVTEQGVAVLANDVPSDAAFSTVESLVMPAVRSVMAVPVELYGKVRGVLYADSARAGAIFDQELLQLVAAIGSIAAVALDNAQRIEDLEDENRRLNAEISLNHDMIGESAAMNEVFKRIAKVAPSAATVLVTGESGTGKELVARAIHRNSPRAARPFAAINCAAITETLLESELFGHEKGAFTGAVAQRKGKLEAAQGGTVFLDEIGELAAGLQAKLLRVLQEREFERVGGTRPIQLDIRLIAATNRDLQEMVRQGTFRGDLYYRLNVVTLRMPALRERREDVEPLAAYFAARSAAKLGKKTPAIPREVAGRLLAYDWPGNVRELENAIERCVVLGTGDRISLDDLPEAMLEAGGDPGGLGEDEGSLHESVRETKRRKVLHALEQAGGNYAQAAAIVGVHPNYFYRLVKNLGIKGKG